MTTEILQHTGAALLIVAIVGGLWRLTAKKSEDRPRQWLAPSQPVLIHGRHRRQVERDRLDKIVRMADRRIS